MMDAFSPICKWIVPSTSGPITWSCAIEVSHMGKKPISYRQRWEKICLPGYTKGKDPDEHDKDAYTNTFCSIL